MGFGFGLGAEGKVRVGVAFELRVGAKVRVATVILARVCVGFGVRVRC